MHLLHRLLASISLAALPALARAAGSAPTPPPDEPLQWQTTWMAAVQPVWDERERSLLLPGAANGQPPPATARASDTRAFITEVHVEARRLAPQGVAVLNAGISGNRLRHDGMGESALARFERDVLRHPGVRAVIVLLGTNDIGWPGGPFAATERLPTLPALARGFRQLVAQAHRRSVRVMAAALPPFEDALKGTPLEGHYSPAKDALRQALNRWIREGGAFDAVVDMDAVLRDHARPTRLRPGFDSGDHLHPGDTGYRAMADAIDLRALLGAATAEARP